MVTPQMGRLREACCINPPSRPPGRTSSRCPWRQGLSTSWTTSWARAKAWTSTPSHPEWAQRGDALPRLHATTQPFHAQSLLPRRLDSTADETRDAADLSESAGHALPEHAEEAEEDDRTQSRRTVGELVQFVRDSTCPGFTPESISPSLAPTTLNPLSNSARRGPAARHTSSLRWCTAELTANRRPEPTDVPSSPPASLLSWSHFPTFALLCTSTTWLRAVPPFL
eukprot:scaffold67528_cov72-Phaeocystis_antarctica.AAC.3